MTLKSVVQTWCRERGFADGEMVYEGKVLLWLQEVVFLLRKPITKKEISQREKRGKNSEGEVIEPEDIVITDEDIAWAAERGMTRAQYVEARKVDQFDLDADSVHVPDEYDERGNLLKFDSINTSYISAVAELYQQQVSLGTNMHPPFRGAGFKQYMDAKHMEADKIRREQFEDRGAGGVNATYSDAEFERVQRRLMKDAAARPEVSLRFTTSLCLSAFWGFWMVFLFHTLLLAYVDFGGNLCIQSLVVP